MNKARIRIILKVTKRLEFTANPDSQDSPALLEELVGSPPPSEADTLWAAWGPLDVKKQKKEGIVIYFFPPLPGTPVENLRLYGLIFGKRPGDTRDDDWGPLVA